MLIFFHFRYGFNVEGVNRLGVKQTVDVGTATGRQRFYQMGYDWQGKRKTLFVRLTVSFVI